MPIFRGIKRPAWVRHPPSSGRLHRDFIRASIAPAPNGHLLTHGVIVKAPWAAYRAESPVVFGADGAGPFYALSGVFNRAFRNATHDVVIDREPVGYVAFSKIECRGASCGLGTTDQGGKKKEERGQEAMEMY